MAAINIGDPDGYFNDLLEKIKEALELKNRTQALKWSILHCALDEQVIDDKELARAKVVRL